MGGIERVRKLKWLCRRGMKELDILLQPFVDRHQEALADGAWPELEPLLRLGTAYWFAVNESIVLAPTLQADVAKGHWSLVYGLSFGVGF